MDHYDLKPLPKPRRYPLIYDILTVLVLLGICGLVYVFWNIFSNPYSRFNPFPPIPTPTAYQSPTPTITIIPLEATWTATPTLPPPPTRTKAPTWTPLPEMVTPTETETPTITATLGTPTVTETPMPAQAEVSYKASTTIHPSSDCKWIGVGGTVVDAQGKAQLFLNVHLGGTLNGKTVNISMLSGSAPAYGSSGFEFVLGDTPADTTGQLWIQLKDTTDAVVLSSQIPIDTFADCSKNLTLVAFTKTP